MSNDGVLKLKDVATLPKVGEKTCLFHWPRPRNYLLLRSGGQVAIFRKGYRPWVEQQKHTTKDW